MVTVKFRTYGMLLFVECRVPSFSPSDNNQKDRVL